MRISNSTILNFKRKLRPNEEADYSSVLKQGKEKLGNTGHSILIVPSASLPQEINTGVGNLLDKEAVKFIDFAKQYWGINYVQLLPEGQYKPKGRGFLPYSGSALDLGTQLINAELLATEDFGNILNKEDVTKLANFNKNQSVEQYINYENVITKNSPAEKVLRKAYDELLKADTQKKKDILVELNSYIQTNKEWLEPKAVFNALSAKYNSSNPHDWNKFDYNFYNTDIVSLPERYIAIKGLRNCELGKEMGFYEFKQFLAEKHLALAKEELNKKGIKLSGDMLAGFSYDEVWANPKAFIKDSFIGWGLPALNYDVPEGEKLLRDKVRNFAKRYDGIRIDASWTYCAQPVENKVAGTKIRKNYDDKILKIIEDEILKTKGKDFNLENLMHEFVANPLDFNIFDQFELKPLARDRVKIYTSFNMSSDWATSSAFKKRGWKDGSYILGATNHDAYPLRVEFKNLTKRVEQIEILSEILKIPKEKLNSIQGFIQAKFAEPMRSKHNMFFFTEVLNILDRYKDNPNFVDDYRVKIPKNYQDNYFKALEKGEGFNAMDALEKAFVAEGLDKTESKLYKKIVKYKKILQESENCNGKWNKKIIISVILVIGGLEGLLCLKNRNKNKAENSA